METILDSERVLALLPVSAKATVLAIRYDLRQIGVGEQIGQGKAPRYQVSLGIGGPGGAVLRTPASQPVDCLLPVPCLRAD